MKLLYKLFAIPTLILCMTIYPAKAFAAGADVSAGDSIEQEETVVEESFVDPVETEDEALVQEAIQQDNSTVIYAINEARDDIVRSVLFAGFLIVGCMAAYMIWRFKV